MEKIFNRSVTYTEIPDDWKTANIVPIFKKGNKSDVGNYRPISLTSLICKILEKLIHTTVEDHLEHNNLIKETQHGFRHGKSCLTNLLEFLNYVTDTVDKNEDIDIAYLDFSKAFDKVPHRRLIYKLESYGISGYLMKWIREWLSDRKQRVVLNGYKSEWKTVTSGVPQGSVLGPLLFIVYINDIDIGINGKISKFADDTKLANIASLSGCQKMQNDLDKLVAWADKWQMEFNYSKCKVMHVGHKNIEFSYSMDGQWINDVDEEKDLGVIISKDLKASRQCLAARNKAMKMLRLINRNVSYKSKEVNTKLYNSYVRPHILCSSMATPLSPRSPYDGKGTTRVNIWAGTT